jgi:hypothetical protein
MLMLYDNPITKNILYVIIMLIIMCMISFSLALQKLLKETGI